MLSCERTVKRGIVILNFTLSWACLVRLLMSLKCCWLVSDGTLQGGSISFLGSRVTAALRLCG